MDVSATYPRIWLEIIGMDAQNLYQGFGGGDDEEPNINLR